MASVEEWKTKFVGKHYVAPGESAPQGKSTFTDSDITVDDFRVVGPHTPASRDFREDRLNVLIDENNICTDVRFY